jgi:Mce-associated membrane protein
VEDQSADPGDLTTDAELPTQTREAIEAAEESDAAGSVEGGDVRTQATDVTADVKAEAAQQAPAPRRRWFSLRRGPKTSETEAISESAEVVRYEAAEPAPRTPVGKSRRNTTKSEPDESAETVDPIQHPKEPAEDVVLVPHRPAGKRPLIAASAAGILFVAGAAFAGATLQPYLTNRAAVDTKFDVARTAASAISTLWTYTPDNMEALPDRAAVFLGGDFADEYRKYIDAIVASNKQAQVTNTTQVMGAAVESLTPTEATALVYTNSVATSPVTKNIPSLRYLSYRLTMQRDDAKWLITRMSTVTSFDLTPQL